MLRSNEGDSVIVAVVELVVGVTVGCVTAVGVAVVGVAVVGVAVVGDTVVGDAVGGTHSLILL